MVFLIQQLVLVSKVCRASGLTEINTKGQVISVYKVVCRDFDVTESKKLDQVSIVYRILCF